MYLGLFRMSHMCGECGKGRAYYSKQCKGCGSMSPPVDWPKEPMSFGKIVLVGLLIAAAIVAKVVIRNM